MCTDSVSVVSYKEIVISRNADRKRTISELYEGCHSKDEAMINRAVLKIGIFAGSPVDHGFSVHDLQHFLKPISDSLNGDYGLRATLAYKKSQFIKINKKLSESNGAGCSSKDKEYQRELSRAIPELSHRVETLSRIESILKEQISRRYDTTGVMHVERPYMISEAVK